jgi:hypothetical protein
LEGCQVLYSRQICLDQITGVYVLITLVFGRQYVTGLRFLQPGGSNVGLGYVIPCQEQFVDIAGQSQLSYELGGFNLAISPKEINANLFPGIN